MGNQLISPRAAESSSDLKIRLAKEMYVRDEITIERYEELVGRVLAGGFVGGWDPVAKRWIA